MWSHDELLAVISGGEELLNLKFDDGLKQALLEGCFESVAVVQESCYRVCEQSGIVETLATAGVIGEDVDATEVIRAVVDESSARYNAFISRFASGFMETDLEMYRWLLYAVLHATPNELERGISLTDINRTLRQVHPRGEELNPGNVTQALKSAASLQVQHGIKPLILDYHQSARRLSVVDRGFLIWVSYLDKDDLLATAGLPTGEPSPKASSHSAESPPETSERPGHRPFASDAKPRSLRVAVGRPPRQAGGHGAARGATGSVSGSVSAG
jgi:hypothetical protein